MVNTQLLIIQCQCPFDLNKFLIIFQQIKKLITNQDTLDGKCIPQQHLPF